ncbi:hypothetical protein DFI02_110137 [Rhizobium sp. PP-F2F-G20b]|nr:hypothetical protein DFI02_110137 [Rhizobium sp. PP-F2F-G20b]
MSFGERVAVIIAFGAVVISFFQMQVMQTQLTSADRNKAYQAFVEELYNVCELFRGLNTSAQLLEAVEPNGMPIGIYVYSDEIPAIQNYRTWSSQAFVNIFTASRKLELAIDIAYMWSGNYHKMNLRALRFDIDRILNDIGYDLLQDDADMNLIYLRVIRAKTQCSDLKEAAREWAAEGDYVFKARRYTVRTRGEPLPSLPWMLDPNKIGG